jgi:hypothetical protein
MCLAFLMPITQVLKKRFIVCKNHYASFSPGELGGDAIASVLFGDVSPSGRLTGTVYPANFINVRNISDMGLQEKGGITYHCFPNFSAKASDLTGISTILANHFGNLGLGYRTPLSHTKS